MRGERAPIGRDAGRGRALELDVLPARHQGERRIAPEEREAAPALGVLHRLEQERGRVVLARARELHERGDGRLEVGEHLAPHGHDGVVAGERDELVARQARGAHRRPWRDSDRAGGGPAAEGAEEAAALAGVAGAPPLLLDHEEQGVDVAVVERLPDVLAVARGLALAPVLLAAPAPVPHASGLERAAQRGLVHPGEHEHLAGALLLDDRADQAVGVVVHTRQLGLGGRDRRDGRGVGAVVDAGASVAGSIAGPRYRPCRASLGQIRGLRAILRQNPAVSEPAPPIAPARPTRLVHDDDVRIDPWFWLRDRDDPEVLAHLEAENAYTRDALAHLSGLRRELYDEIVGRVQESDTTAPVRRGRLRVLHPHRRGTSSTACTADARSARPRCPIPSPPRAAHRARWSCSTRTRWPRVTTTSRSATSW